MYKTGDKVGVEVRGEKLYGWVIDVDKTGAVSVCIGKERIIQARPCDLWYDEGYKKLKQERFT